MKSGNYETAIAQQREKDGVITIQSTLISAQGLNDPAPFQRVLQQLPQKLCEGIADGFWNPQSHASGSSKHSRNSVITFATD